MIVQRNAPSGLNVGLCVVPRKSSSPLENLPAELGLQILLSMPDFDTLHRLVHASPVMFALYRTHSTSILRSLLDRELACIPRLHASMTDHFSISNLPVMPLTDELLVRIKQTYYEVYSRKRLVCQYLSSVERNSLCSLAKHEKNRQKHVMTFITNCVSHPTRNSPIPDLRLAGYRRLYDVEAPGDRAFCLDDLKAALPVQASSRPLLSEEP